MAPRIDTRDADLSVAVAPLEVAALGALLERSSFTRVSPELRA